MADELQFRKVSDLEELEALDGTELIPVISEGKMKAVSKANAKFGGGSTTFYANSEPTSAAEAGVALAEARESHDWGYIVLYKDPESGEAATLQEIYDALTSGSVWIAMLESESNFICALVTVYAWGDINGGQTDPDNIKGIIFYTSMGEIYMGAQWW